MSTILKTLGMIMAIALLSACGGRETKEVASTPDPVEKPEPVKTTGAEGLGKLNGIAIDKDDSPDAVRTVYFEYDSSRVRSDFIPLIDAHAKLLASDASRKVALEGHADERGSREYNIGLGERRANAVKSLLLASGAKNSQLRTLSYGEERPAVTGHDESAWSKNRRVEIRYE